MVTMISKDWDKKIKKFFIVQGTDKEKREAVPLRDWHIFIVAFVAIFVSSVGLHVYLFLMVNEESIFTTVTTKNEIVELDKEKLGRVLDAFSKKDIAFEHLKNEPITAVDPSR